MKTLRQRIVDYLLEHEDEYVINTEIAEAVGTTTSQVSQVMYVLCKDSREIHKYDRGVWIYNPSEPVVPVVPLTHRLYDLLSTGSYTRFEIAKELGIKANEVAGLVGRMNKELLCRAESEAYYSLVKK